MDTPLLIATIAASVSIMGWIINYALSGYRDRRNQQLAASLKYTERQLEELYGPLAFLILEGKRTFIDLLETLGRPYVFQQDKALSENELKLWLFWAENSLLPRNEKMKDLLMTKTHLIEGEKIPASYLSFLDHCNSWKITHLRWQKEGVEYSWHSKINWPKEFDQDVLSTFEKLKARHSRFLRKLSKDN
jgi:hypothetical protein